MVWFFISPFEYPNTNFQKWLARFSLIVTKRVAEFFGSTSACSLIERIVFPGVYGAIVVFPFLKKSMATVLNLGDDARPVETGTPVISFSSSGSRTVTSRKLFFSTFTG